MRPRTNTTRRRKKASLTEANRTRQSEEWLKTNRGALDAYNKHVKKHGVFSDWLRSF